MTTMYYMWVSTFQGVISEAKGYWTEQALRAGLPIFVRQNLGGDVADSDVTGFRIDLETGETEIIPVDRTELDRLGGDLKETCSRTRRNGVSNRG